MNHLLERFRRPLFLGIVALQILVLAYMVLNRQQLLASPKSAFLQCEPVDPRSLLSGDYVILRYTISEFEGEELTRLNRFNESYRTNEFIYVALKAGEAQAPRAGNAGDKQTQHPPPHQAVAISKDLAKLQGEYDLILRGRVLYDFIPPTPAERAEFTDEFHGYSSLQIRYGVEEYFVPQFQGLEIEHAMAKTVVEVAVADSGESAIRQLFLDGEVVEFY